MDVNARVFWIFGILRSVSLGIILFVIFRSLNAIKGETIVGPDTGIVLSITLPLFSLLVDYTILTKK